MTKINKWVLETGVVIETFFYKDRFYVRIQKPDETKFIMPRANYVWLKNNPSFVSIPVGYVVHHLDHNKTNDDISNIVIMFKHHHTAYHAKQIRPKDRADVDYDLSEYPQEWVIKSPPCVRAKNVLKGKTRPVIDFYSYHNGPGHANGVRVVLATWKGKSLETESEAHAAAAEIWSVFGINGLKAANNEVPVPRGLENGL
jgi:hypothetical protein